jgi:hypothetical protein
MTPSGSASSHSHRVTIHGISLQTPLGDDAFVVTGFQYSQTLGQLFEILLELQSKSSSLHASSRYFNAIMGTFRLLARATVAM